VIKERAGMVSFHQYHEISESSHRILNPLSLDKLLQLGGICNVGPGTRLLESSAGLVGGRVAQTFAAANLGSLFGVVS
jgi:hypothetical protein